MDMHTHAGSAFDFRMTLTFVLLTSELRPAERLSRTFTLCQPSLVLIAQAVFRLKRGHTRRQTDRHPHIVTDATDHPTNARVGCYQVNKSV